MGAHSPLTERAVNAAARMLVSSFAASSSGGTELVVLDSLAQSLFRPLPIGRNVTPPPPPAPPALFQVHTSVAPASPTAPSLPTGNLLTGFAAAVVTQSELARLKCWLFVSLDAHNTALGVQVRRIVQCAVVVCLSSPPGLLTLDGVGDAGCISARARSGGALVHRL